MTGPKTNEGATTRGERTGTRARVRYVRSSASKARVVLDLIRGKSVREADEILQFTERDIASVIRKALASAVANAQHNDLQDPEELYVRACYADEGPTLKRFRPRARGRAGRINKRTCHITIVVDRMPDDVLDARRARAEAKAASRPAAAGGRARRTAMSRRDRVARSRQADATAAAAPATPPTAADVAGGEPTDEMVTDAVEVAESEGVEVEAPETEAPEASTDETAEPTNEEDEA
jgi:large subunit ribosomal protein L22